MTNDDWLMNNEGISVDLNFSFDLIAIIQS